MFFKVTLCKDLLLEPKEMGKHAKARVGDLLRLAVEGKIVGNSGFVIAVLSITSIGSGQLDNSMGSAVYRVQYEALVFRPFEQEIVDCVVVSCNPHGIQCTLAGMMDVFVHRLQMPSDIDSFTDGAWVSQDGQVQIRAQCGLRLRIMTLRFEAQLIAAVGTINDHFCGVLFTDEEEAGGMGGATTTTVVVDDALSEIAVIPVHDDDNDNDDEDENDKAAVAAMRRVEEESNNSGGGEPPTPNKRVHQSTDNSDSASKRMCTTEDDNDKSATKRARDAAEDDNNKPSPKRMREDDDDDDDVVVVVG